MVRSEKYKPSRFRAYLEKDRVIAITFTPVRLDGGKIYPPKCNWNVAKLFVHTVK